MRPTKLLKRHISKSKSKTADRYTPDQLKTFADIGESQYETIKASLERRCIGGFVCIHLDSRKYVVGKSREEASRLYASQFGNKPGYLRKIGEIEYVGNINF